jgi:hypothetical protein
MKKVLFLLLFAAVLASGQDKSPLKKYVDIPSAPTLKNPTALLPSTECCGGGVYNFNIAGDQGRGGDLLTSGSFKNGFSLRQFDGDASHIYRFVITPGTVFGSPSGGQHGVSITDHGNYLYFYGLDAANPGITNGKNGFQLAAVPGGSHFVIQNFVAKSISESGLTANYDTGSGSYYDNLDISFYRTFNAGQEGIGYIGATHPGFAYINVAKVYHNFSYKSGREGTQFEHINLLTAHHNTCIQAGQEGVSEQTNSLQAHDLGPGSTISYSIYDGSPVPFNIFTHGTTISHSYFGFTTAGGYIGRTDNCYFSSSTRLRGDSLIFDGDYFNYTGSGTLPYLTIIDERVAHIIFRNCTFSPNIKAIYLDRRASGYKNTITGKIGDHGNVSAKIVPPVYATGYNNPDDYLNQGLINPTSPYYSRHFGYRTP